MHKTGRTIRRIFGSAINRVGVYFFIVILVACMNGCAPKETPKVYHVGIIGGINGEYPIAQGFMDKLKDFGYIDGENITFDVQIAHSDRQVTKDAVERFISNHVDLIFTFPSVSTQIALQETQGSNIPIVFAFTTVENAGIIQSLSNPGGNITGIRYPGPDLTAKRLDLLLEIDPKIKRVWYIYDENYPTAAVTLQTLRKVAKNSKITLVESPVSTLEEIKTEITYHSNLANPGMDAILIAPDNLTQSDESWKLINSFAMEHHLPVCGSATLTATKGALLSYGPDLYTTGEFAANLAVQIFRGTPAGSIPVFTPESNLEINLKTADQLGLSIDEGFLKLASTIIPSN